MLDRKALVIGIDHYPGHALNSCVRDATAMAELLRRNGDENKTRNFDVALLTSGGDDDVTNAGLIDAVAGFFNSSVTYSTAVLYFAGHGTLNPGTDAGYIVGTDGRSGAPGMSMSDLLGLANEACRTNRIQSAVVILDCCHAGHIGQPAGRSHSGGADVRKGVTILSSCTGDQTSQEGSRHGMFTELLLDGLDGGCADVRGNITPAAIYAHIDQALAWRHAQRPLYMANVHNFITLRQIKPPISPLVLLRLPEHFPHPDMVKKLDPSYEPDRLNVSEAIRQVPVNPENALVFKELQALNRQGLLVPVDCDHMFDAAIKSKGCRLTGLGRHYHRLAKLGLL